MRRVQTVAETAKQAAEWAEKLRESVADAHTSELPHFALWNSDADELAELLERLAERKPKSIACDVGRYPCVHEERMPTFNCDRCPRNAHDECEHCHFTRAEHEVAA
tara:strand:+ start:1565 stop:1885 length:321 start_codon:yes stop_codon:yes gene_type:complete